MYTERTLEFRITSASTRINFPLRYKLPGVAGVDVRFGPSPGVLATWTLLELAPETTETILAWLQYRGLEPGALFTAVSKADKPLLGRRISPSGIGYLFKIYCQMLGINKLTPRDSRRTYCSSVLDVLDVLGIDPKTAMDMARHRSFDTTARYDRRGNEKRKRVAAKLSMQFDKHQKDDP